MQNVLRVLAALKLVEYRLLVAGRLIELLAFQLLVELLALLLLLFSIFEIKLSELSLDLSHLLSSLLGNPPHELNLVHVFMLPPEYRPLPLHDLLLPLRLRRCLHMCARFIHY